MRKKQSNYEDKHCKSSKSTQIYPAFPIYLPPILEMYNAPIVQYSKKTMGNRKK